MTTDPSAHHDDAVLARARAAADEIASGRRSAPKARAPDWALPLGLAAAVAIAVIGLSWVLPGSDGGGDELRGTSAAATVFPEPGAALAAAPTELRWSAQPGARQYRVTLRDASAAIVWQSAATRDPRVELGAPPPLQAGGTYFWAVSVEGAVAADELGPFMFQITRP